MSSTEMMLACCPRPLGRRVSGDGCDGDLPGDRGRVTLERCEMALLEDGRPMRKCSLEAMLVMGRGRDVEMEDWSRIGRSKILLPSDVSSISRF